MKIQYKILQSGNDWNKNTLYKIVSPLNVIFTEEHKDRDTKEVVSLKYCLGENQFGVYASEYRAAVIEKTGSKTTDILACVLDEEKKTVNTFIADVKSNISAFSDDLLQNSAILTAIKEVRDFSMQIYEEYLYKNNFMMFYKAEGYTETETFCIITKHFEAHKFRQAAEMLSNLFQKENDMIPALVKAKLKMTLQSYIGEKDKLEKFAEKKIFLGERIQNLSVVILEKEKDNYCTQMEISAREVVAKFLE